MALASIVSMGVALGTAIRLSEEQARKGTEEAGELYIPTWVNREHAERRRNGSVSRVELFGKVLMYLDTIAADAEAKGDVDSEEVADYVRGVLMPFVVEEQGWAVLSEGAARE